MVDQYQQGGNKPEAIKILKIYFHAVRACVLVLISGALRGYTSTSNLRQLKQSLQFFKYNLNILN
jgi:hypothetical protein